VAYAGLQKVLLDRVSHQVVVDRRLRHLFVVLDRLVIVLFERGEIGGLEPELVRETAVTALAHVR
jgi:hypothetical protein